MAHTYANSHRNGRLNLLTVDSGAACTFRVYDDTGGVPSDVRQALTTQVLLAECTMANPIAPGASNAVLTLTTPFSDPSANASGAAAFYRWGTGADIVQGTIGTSGADLIVNNVNVTQGLAFTVDTGVINEPH